MAPRSYTLFVILSILFILSLSHIAEAKKQLRPSQCQPKCTYRCSATSHKKPCMKYCLQCCAKCLCVPPGTYGNKEKCHCYNVWKTQEGRPKCP